MRHVRLLASALAAALLAAACSSDGLPSSSGESTTTTLAAEPTITVLGATEDRDEVPPSTTSGAEPAAPPTTAGAPTTTLPTPDYDFSAVSPIISDFIDDRQLNGAGLIIVHRDFGVIHHEHWGEFDEDRISLIASSSKMVAAGVLAHLADDGLLDLDAPVSEVVAWGSGNPEITPAQLVSNSSGLIGLLQNPQYGPYLCQWSPAGTLQDCGEQIFTTPDDDDLIIAPDQEFHYGGAQWQVAGAVAEAASGQSWAELIDEIYVQPCGLESFGYVNPYVDLPVRGFEYPDDLESLVPSLLSTENPNIEAGVFTTTGDYAKLLLMHLRGGRCGEHQVLSQEALDVLHRDRIAEAYDGSGYTPDRGYGMGWWIDRPSGRLNDGGAFGSVPWLDLADGYGAYLVIEADSLTGNALAGQLYDVIDDAVAAAGG